MKVSDIMTVLVDRLDHQGRGIAKVEDKVIFIPGVLEKEVVKIEILKIKKRIVEAKCIELITSSSDRIKSICPYFGICGGCDLLHMMPQKQLEYKEKKVTEILYKFAHLSIQIDPIVSSSFNHYRNKVIFQVDSKIGFYQKKSNQVVEIHSCFLLQDKMNEILKILESNMDLSFVKQIMIRESKNDCMIVFYGTKEFQNSVIPIDLLKGIFILVKRENYELICGKDYLIEQVKEYEFKISPDSFFQVNTKGMELLYQTVLQNSGLTGKEKVLDLYCGTGTIGIFLSKKADQVIGIEINEHAVKDAIWNQKRNHIHNIEFLCGDSGTLLRNLEFDPDLVIVDPPRSGLDETAITELKRIKSKKLIYVSCDPVTLARDIALLEEEYSVLKVIPVDMFPNTYHVECVCVLNLR